MTHLYLPFKKTICTLTNDIRQSVEQRQGFKVWWLGQEQFFDSVAGQTSINGPCCPDSLSVKYANTTTNTHVRMSELVVNPVTFGYD
ncbi:MAG: hypothetical protein R2822_07810 [Spirosomataceae bacterium]